MQTFFNKVSVAEPVLPGNPSWSYAQAGLLRNLELVTAYYRARPFSVKSNHFLVKLLNSLGVTHTADTQRFFDIVDTKALHLGMSLKMSSSIYRGQVFDGVFYGPGTKEILIAVNSYANPYTVERNWKDYNAIRVLDHPRSDLELTLPNGKDASYETGLAVLAIDIAALAVQFRAFAKEQYAYSLQTGNNPHTVAQFVHMYVLPNMLKEHLNVALMNRAINRVIGAPMGESPKKHPFMLIDYSKYVDDSYKTWTKFAQERDASAHSVLKSFEAVELTFEEVCRLPDQAPTRQITWVESLARLKVINWLTLISPTAGRRTNALEVQSLVKDLKRLMIDNSFSQIDDADVYYSCMQMIRDVIRRIDAGDATA